MPFWGFHCTAFSLPFHRDNLSPQDPFNTSSIWLGGGLWPWPQMLLPMEHSHLPVALHSAVKMPRVSPIQLSPPIWQLLLAIALLERGVLGLGLEFMSWLSFYFLASEEPVRLTCCLVGSLGMGRGWELDGGYLKEREERTGNQQLE